MYLWEKKQEAEHFLRTGSGWFVALAPSSPAFFYHTCFRRKLCFLFLYLHHWFKPTQGPRESDGHSLGDLAHLFVSLICFIFILFESPIVIAAQQAPYPLLLTDVLF